MNHTHRIKSPHPIPFAACSTPAEPCVLLKTSLDLLFWESCSSLTHLETAPVKTNADRTWYTS